MKSTLGVHGLGRRDDGRRFVWLINMTNSETEATPLVVDGSLTHLDGGAEVSTVTLPPFGVLVLRLET